MRGNPLDDLYNDADNGITYNDDVDVDNGLSITTSEDLQITNYSDKGLILETNEKHEDE